MDVGRFTYRAMMIVLRKGGGKGKGRGNSVKAKKGREIGIKVEKRRGSKVTLSHLVSK